MSDRSLRHRRATARYAAGAFCVWATSCGRIGYESNDFQIGVGSDSGTFAGAAGASVIGTGGASPAGGASGGAAGTAGSSGGGAAGTGGGSGGGSGGGIVDAGAEGSIRPTDASIVSGLELRYRFDEPSGTVAFDSSGNGFDGTYIGTSGTPTPSPDVPSLVVFSDPASRAFVAANRHAVRIIGTPQRLKPANDLTITAWYRANSVGGQGSDILSQGDNYALRLQIGVGGFELAKAQRAGTWVSCFATPPAYLDGSWHHVAGVIASTGMKIYFDGAQAGSNPDGTNISYPFSTELDVGRHGNGSTLFDMNGNLDDVRVYSRALSDVEIGLLAQGSN